MLSINQKSIEDTIKTSLIFKMTMILSLFYLSYLCFSLISRLLQTILFMVMIHFMFILLLITKSPLILWHMRRVQPSYLETNGKDATLPKTLGNHPYINVKRPDYFYDYIKNIGKFRLLLLSNEFMKLSSSYPSRFPKVLSSIVRSWEWEGM